MAAGTVASLLSDVVPGTVCLILLPKLSFSFSFLFLSFLLLDGRKISEVMREIFRLMGPPEAYPKCELVVGRMNRKWGPQY